MQNLISGLQPTMYSLIGIGVLLFVSHPKQVKKWEVQPPEPFTFKLLRMFLSGIFLIVYAATTSLLLSPSLRYALVNFIIIIVLTTAYTGVVISDMNKYSKADRSD